jgi:AbiU2
VRAANSAFNDDAPQAARALTRTLGGTVTVELTSDELKSGIGALAKDVVDAQIHWKLSRGILDAMSKWPLVHVQSNTFWSLTLTAHVQVSVLAACRIYDQEKSSLHLLSLIQLISRNVALFEPNFRVRLRDNPFVASLLESARTPDPAQLEVDARLCSVNNDLVRRLVIHRNNAVAHLSRRRSLAGAEPRKEDEITNEDFEVLLSRADQILNRYSNLFQAEHFSNQIVGHDDYETIFRWVQDRVELERERYGNPEGAA